MLPELLKVLCWIAIVIAICAALRPVIDYKLWMNNLPGQKVKGANIEDDYQKD